MKNERTKKLIKKHAICGALICALVLGTIGGANFVSAAAVEEVKAQTAPQVTILVDDVAKNFFNVSGAEVQPIIYGGTTYLPLRSIGELMNKNVNWDASSLTISLDGTRNGNVVKGTVDANAKRQDVVVQIRPDFTVKVDGTAQKFADANGKAVYPMLYNGSTYLPLRSVGAMMGKTVSWNGATETIALSAPNGALVTDADSFNQTPATQPAKPETKPGIAQKPNQKDPATVAGTIGVEKAKEIAFKHAGVAAKDAVKVEVDFDYDHGVQTFDVDFHSAGFEYDYEINALTGDVIHFEKEKDGKGKAKAPAANKDTAATIDATKAKDVAFKHAGVAAKDAVKVEVELDRDHGVQVFEVEFHSAGYEYDYEINAQTGEVLHFDKEYDD